MVSQRNQCIEVSNELKDIEYDIEEVERELEDQLNALEQKEAENLKPKLVDESWFSSVADDLYGSRVNRMTVKDSLRYSTKSKSSRHSKISSKSSRHNPSIK